eukprot:CAMPEP_0177180842 /NCGR_PEP_ID=MMETSP0367-20130122/15606_1 /TAXON_ID=447022 ORGANISM="Scrippsiella hangoei-like, Strain SHHI-4" /NCGR_SAMPLE_ID=MMETSP0367 /ASSEMBLY_ACC=CAM_ASM_000362 /LENGTH=169 /DNA_ID=CAMNT_0018627651 /DNA_START=301 /DNA_END=808 /DNA_ORIENTATION=-
MKLVKTKPSIAVLTDESPMSMANVFLLATTGAVFFFSSFGAFFTACGCGSATFSTARTGGAGGAGAAGAGAGAGAEAGALATAAPAFWSLPFLPFFVVISATTGSGSGAATFTCSSWTSSSSLSESERRAANPFFCGIALFFGGMSRKAARARRLRCDEAGVPGSQRAW